MTSRDSNRETRRWRRSFARKTRGANKTRFCARRSFNRAKTLSASRVCASRTRASASDASRSPKRRRFDSRARWTRRGGSSTSIILWSKLVSETSALTMRRPPINHARFLEVVVIRVYGLGPGRGRLEPVIAPTQRLRVQRHGPVRDDTGGDATRGGQVSFFFRFLFVFNRGGQLSTVTRPRSVVQVPTHGLVQRVPQQRVAERSELRAHLVRAAGHELDADLPHSRSAFRETRLECFFVCIGSRQPAPGRRLVRRAHRRLVRLVPPRRGGLVHGVARQHAQHALLPGGFPFLAVHGEELAVHVRRAQESRLRPLDAGAAQRLHTEGPGVHPVRHLAPGDHVRRREQRIHPGGERHVRLGHVTRGM
mmetsp:Transcript_11972/g.50126  ORF Transcript_11972/g.50126 Transcript_11972/m.50126 type:complete len:366 (+) Transcript_11972:595-1692(+)